MCVLACECVCAAGVRVTEDSEEARAIELTPAEEAAQAGEFVVHLID